MTDLVCESCNWVEAGFDNDTEIAEYMEETELLETHFADQDCPKCGAEESLEVYYRMCQDCGEAEPDCMCDVETEDLSDEEAERMREKVLSTLQDELEDRDLEKERRQMQFRERDLRTIAESLINEYFGEPA